MIEAAGKEVRRMTLPALTFGMSAVEARNGEITTTIGKRRSLRGRAGRYSRTRVVRHRRW